MDNYKLKFTKLQNEILRLLYTKTGEKFNQRQISKILGVSPTAIMNSVKSLVKEKIIYLEKSKTMNLNLIELNRDNALVIGFKRTENLKMIYESGIIKFLEENFPGTTIILFGSYSYGEDTSKSDIDLAVIGTDEKDINLEEYNKFFEKEIRINFYKNFNEINKNLKNNIINGIVLVGRTSL